MLVLSNNMGVFQLALIILALSTRQLSSHLFKKKVNFIKKTSVGYSGRNNTTVPSLKDSYLTLHGIEAFAFKLHQEEKKWMEAMETCCEEKAFLALVFTEKQLNIVSAFAEDAYKPDEEDDLSSNSFWIGLYRDSTSYIWDYPVARLPLLKEDLCTMLFTSDDPEDPSAWQEECAWRAPFICQKSTELRRVSTFSPCWLLNKTYEQRFLQPAPFLPGRYYLDMSL